MPDQRLTWPVSELQMHGAVAAPRGLHPLAKKDVADHDSSVARRASKLLKFDPACSLLILIRGKFVIRERRHSLPQSRLCNGCQRYNP